MGVIPRRCRRWRFRHSIVTGHAELTPHAVLDRPRWQPNFQRNGRERW